MLIKWLHVGLCLIIVFLNYELDSLEIIYTFLISNWICVHEVLLESINTDCNTDKLCPSILFHSVSTFNFISINSMASTKSVVDAKMVALFIVAL